MTKEKISDESLIMSKEMAIENTVLVIRRGKKKVLYCKI